jgi:multisubunit Na+/H+ antiporter MnhB subunit
MTFAEFIAACFWPTVGLFGLLLTRTRDHVLRQYFTIAAIVMFFLYFVLAIVGANSSMIAVIDLYVLAGVLGLLVLGYGYNRWGHDKPGAPSSFREKCAGVGLIVIGAGIVWISGSTLFQDFVEPRFVLEGRAESFRKGGGRHSQYLASIAGRTVKVTTPVYERLQFKPYVRAEVGRGSNYIFSIEYLAN